MFLKTQLLQNINFLIISTVKINFIIIKQICSICKYYLETTLLNVNKGLKLSSLCNTTLIFWNIIINIVEQFLILEIR